MKNVIPEQDRYKVTVNLYLPVLVSMHRYEISAPKKWSACNLSLKQSMKIRAAIIFIFLIFWLFLFSICKTKALFNQKTCQKKAFVNGNARK
jgi:hypothetical protein